MLCWSDRKPYNCLGRGSPITSWMFWTCYISSCILLTLFLPGSYVQLLINLTYGLKPQVVSDIKIVTVCRRSIFQVELLFVTLIYWLLWIVVLIDWTSRAALCAAVVSTTFCFEDSLGHRTFYSKFQSFVFLSVFKVTLGTRQQDATGAWI